ncbi:transposase [Enhygromyxa salina]|uniref:Transposase n=1 Tax=Enhygromyxa salina TaxID=215803 RepID=A0A2S9XGW6_9BACT|nr:transposase [Enhygromyxa salina]PRP92116.1 Transposase [Enhygromyxa salina]
MPTKPTSKRRHCTAEQKAAIVRRHMVDKVPVSDLCDEHGIQPSVLHAWHKQVADNLAKVFDSLEGGDRARAARDGELVRKDQQIAALEARIAKKDSVIADISEEHIALKKTLGVR